MIYKKEANFPYPLLTNTSDSYEQCQFTLDIDLQENTEHYHFNVKSEIESPFNQNKQNLSSLSSQRTINFMM